MTFENEEILEATIVKVEGRPNSPKQPGEQARWKGFKAWLFPYLKKSKELAAAYSQAEVTKKENEARKIAEEAAEIAARKDVTKQKEVQTFNAIIDDIFANDTLPPGAKALKLAKLMEKNPQIAKQLEEVKDIIEKLALTRGVNIEVVNDSQKSLPENKDTIDIEENTEKETIDEELVAKLNTPIAELELSVRASNCLESVKVEVVGQLVEMTEEDLLKIRSLGRTSLREIKIKLADIGLHLGMIDAQFDTLIDERDVQQVD